MVKAVLFKHKCACTHSNWGVSYSVDLAGYQLPCNTEVVLQKFYFKENGTKLLNLQTCFASCTTYQKRSTINALVVFEDYFPLLTNGP
jgi:hypothetical protein